MKKNVKIALTIVILAISVVALRALYSGSDSSDNFSNDDTLIEDLTVFEVNDDELSELQIDSAFSRFKRQRDALLATLTDGEIVGTLTMRPLVELSLVHRDIGALSKAERGLLRALEIAPGAFIVNGNLGDLYYRYFNDYEKAAPYFHKAVEVNSPYVETYYSELYEIYRFRFNDNDKAVDVLMEGIERYPEATDILAQLALHYRQLGQTDTAIEYYKELQARKPDSIVAEQALSQLE